MMLLMMLGDYNNSKKMIESDIKNHNAPIKKLLLPYKLFQWGNLVMIHFNATFERPW